MMRLGKYIFAIVMIACCFRATAFAQDISFEISVDRNKIAVGQSLQLNLMFAGIQEVEPFALPESDQIKSQYLGPATRMSIINGKVSSSITHMYSLLGIKPGIVSIGPFTVELEGKQYTSNKVQIEIVQDSADISAEPEVSFADNKDVSDRVFLTLQADKKTAYVNELIPVKIKLYVNQLGVRDIQFPVLTNNQFSLSDFSQPRQYKEEINGVAHDVLEFDTFAAAAKPGQLSLGPMQLSCNLISRKNNFRRPNASDFDDFFNTGILNNFFDNYQLYPLTVKSADLALTIKDLPQENKPADFSGAAGDFKFTVDVSSQEVKAGDPITLNMQVSGVGNLSKVNNLALNLGPDFKVYDQKVKQQGDRKIFEQIIIPLNENIVQIPKISFSFFDPAIDQYKTVFCGPFPLKVTKPSVTDQFRMVESKSADSSSANLEKLGQDIVFIKESLTKTYPRKKPYFYYFGFWFWQFIPLAGLAAVFFANRWRNRIANDSVLARKLRATKIARESLTKLQNNLGQTDCGSFYDNLYKALKSYLGDRLAIPAGGIVADEIEKVLNARGCTKDMIDKIKKILNDCDVCRYAPNQFQQQEMAESLRRLKEVMDYLENNKL